MQRDADIVDLKAPIEVRRATAKDSRMIFEWRNDETTRGMSHTTDEVLWEDHQKWYDETLQNQNRCLLMCFVTKTNEQAAVARFDVDHDVALISINLSPVMRGKGLAKICLIKAVAYFLSIYQSVSRIEAEIKSINIPSRKAFEGAGFQFQKDSDGTLLYEYFADR